EHRAENEEEQNPLHALNIIAGVEHVDEKKDETADQSHDERRTDGQGDIIGERLFRPVGGHNDSEYSSLNRPLVRCPTTGASLGHARRHSICRAGGRTRSRAARRRQTGSHTTSASDRRENRRFPSRFGPRRALSPPRTPAVVVRGWGEQDTPWP